MPKFLDSLEWYDSTGNLQGVEKSTVQLGASATASGDWATALGAGAKANGFYATALGSSANASSGSAIALGTTVNASGNSAIAIGGMAKASGSYATAIGVGAKADGPWATVLGYGATADGEDATALGHSAKAGQSRATAVGQGATAGGEDAVALGSGATASGIGAIALGSYANAPDNFTIVLGSNSITSLQCQVQTISELSDSRVKEDVALANTAQCLEDVNRLPVSRYKYKDFTGVHLDTHRTGFMADDVEKVFPKAVAKFDKTFPVLDEEGNKVYEQEVDEKGNPVYEQAVDESGVALFNEDGSIKYDEAKPVMKEKTFVLEDVKTIAMQDAIPTLWGAVQELTKRLEVAEAKIEELLQ